MIPGYIVCLHILEQGAPVTYQKKPVPGDLGELVCVIPGPLHTLEDLALICEDCALERGFLGVV